MSGKRNMHNRIMSVLLSVLLLMGLVFTGTGKKAEAASARAITDILLLKGSNAPAELEEKGYSAMMRPLCGSGEDSVYLGYKRGGSSPITGMLLSTGRTGSLTHDGKKYIPVSDISVLSKGSAYLYISRDSGDGSQLMAMTLTSDSGFEDIQLLALQNDGTVPIRFDSGKVADLGSGDRTYLFLTYSNICKPYIREVIPVTGRDKREAVLNAAAKCDYYYDGGFTDGNGAYLVIGYNRCMDESGALRSITAYPVKTGNSEDGSLTFPEAKYLLTADIACGGEQGFWLYATGDPAAGNPIMELTSSAIPARSTDVSGKLMESLFLKSASSIAGNLVKSESLYQQLSIDRKQLTHVPVMLSGGEELSSTPLAFTCLAEGLPEIRFEEAAKPEDAEDEGETENTEDPGSTDGDSTKTPGKEEGSDAANSEESKDSDGNGGSNAGKDSSVDEETEENKDSAAVEEVDDTDSDPGDRPPEIVDDFDPDNYLDQQAEVIADDKAPDEAASMIGEGNLSSLLIIAGLVLLGVGGGVLANKLSKKKEGGKNDSRNDDTEEN